MRLTQWAIYRAIRRGDLAAYKPGGRLRIREADLEGWLESTRVQADVRAPARSLSVTTVGALAGAARPRAAADSVRARVRASRSRGAAR